MNAQNTDPQAPTTALAPLITMSEEQFAQIDRDPPGHLIGMWAVYIRQLHKELSAQRRALAEVTRREEAQRDELATCCLCEYEFDEPHTASDRGRNTVCVKCWPHDADARGWKQRAELAEARASEAERERDEARTQLARAIDQLAGRFSS